MWISVLSSVILIGYIQRSASLPVIRAGPFKGGILDEDEYFDDREIPFGEISDISLGLQSLFVSFTQNMEKINSRMDILEGQSKAVIDRLNIFDCYDLKIQNPLRPSGIYKLYLDHIGKRPVSVYCDMVTDGGGWTVIQQRFDRKPNSSMISFDKPFHEYKVGFGSPESDYWIGLENIHVWTNTRQYELRIHLEDFNNNTGHGEYSTFFVDSERHGYRLHVGSYSGDIGDSLGNNLTQDNYTAHGMMFSTEDMDQDTSYEINCSKFWNIGGWWFNRCSWANLNGPYRFPSEGTGIGINWHKWRNKEYMKATKMMIRPAKYFY